MHGVQQRHLVQQPCKHPCERLPPPQTEIRAWETGNWTGDWKLDWKLETGLETGDRPDPILPSARRNPAVRRVSSVPMIPTSPAHVNPWPLSMHT